MKVKKQINKNQPGKNMSTMIMEAKTMKIVQSMNGSS